MQAGDDLSRISAERRDIFTKQTFARSTSVLSPMLWWSVAREMPGDFGESRAARRRRRQAARRPRDPRSARRLPRACSRVLLALAAPLRWVARRVIEAARSEKAPDRLRKVVAALWTLAVLAALPLVGLGIVSYALDLFDMSDPRLQGVVNALFDGLRMSALGLRFRARAAVAQARAVAAAARWATRRRRG